jgi:hypothetical protein
VREGCEIPPPPPGESLPHRMFQGWGAGCQTWHDAPVDLHAEVRGQGRMGGPTGPSESHRAHGDACAHSADPHPVVHAAQR